MINGSRWHVKKRKCPEPRPRAGVTTCASQDLIYITTAILHPLHLPSIWRLVVIEHVMDSLIVTDRLHLLNLPAEIRNTIYSYVFEQHLDHQLDLLAWHQFLPHSSLTYVSRQTRSECQALHKEALIDLWKRRHWIFEIDARFIGEDHRHKLWLECERLPRSVPVRHLSVVFDFPCTPYGPRPPISFDFKVDEDGLVEWKLRHPASIVSHYRTMVLENVLQTAMRGRLKSGLTLDEDPRYLDVRHCTRPFFEIFDEIPFFSALQFWEY